ncbi:NAD(P)/FAD-dependent oxidoreductase [Pseudonocardia hydrocarbonoxydans]|uniref:Oxidoreductase n=1 Tax=Pseudonocardia hydrocarbonoxydans TaxID=76726 RepID=A0A4Y3WWC5_9PSEU|nr:NAD(P)/FAD-dependent oxidoreductase [Pseudonocardia hydrocarbonoxydans]GEC21666.1 oxidoreductase [Pseudonocardia hydrocarbonoxydans]
MTDVLVVGAGLAGLRAAQLLTRRGLEVTVLDAADRPGGRMATDVVDGFRCDRGFQVLNTSYPALRTATDLAALDLRAFEPGAAIRGGDGALHRFANPVRRPSQAFATAVDGLFGVADKARLVAWTARVLATPPSRTAGIVDRSAAQDLAAAGLDGPVVERFLRPFLSGVLGESALATSAAFVRLVWRSFALGTVAVPADGMGALPARLAAGLPDGVLRLGRRVTTVRPGVVHTADGEHTARAVLVATDPVAAGTLLPGLDVAPMHALTTYYHVTDTPPAELPLLHLDGTGGPVANTVVLTRAAPGYSPDDRALVSSTVLGDPLPEPQVRRELARVYGRPVEGWELLHTAPVRAALPAFRPGHPVRRDVALGDGLFVAGDHRDTPSTQGALVSGRRAAQAVLEHLGVRRPI